MRKYGTLIAHGLQVSEDCGTWHLTGDRDAGWAVPFIFLKKRVFYRFVNDIYGSGLPHYLNNRRCTNGIYP